MNIQKRLPLLNVLWIAVLLGVLSGSLYFQFFVGDQPCRMCTWQRMTMALIVGVLLHNLKFGQDSRNYGVIIIFALFGASVSIRQILAYIMPGSLGFGPVVFGLHTYTWALLVFICSIAASAVILVIGVDSKNEYEKLPSRLISAVFAAAIVVTLTFSAATMAQCGLEVCPAATEYRNPTAEPLLNGSFVSDEELCCPDAIKRQ